VKTKPKSKSATSPRKASSDLRGWPVIAQFLGLPNSTVHRWAKEGMPVRREGRNVVASPEELNQWLRRTSGEASGVHVITPGSDLLKDLRASVAAQKSGNNLSPQPKNGPPPGLPKKPLKRKRPASPTHFTS
jgi:hypothetical protein